MRTATTAEVLAGFVAVYRTCFLPRKHHLLGAEGARRVFVAKHAEFFECRNTRQLDRFDTHAVSNDSVFKRCFHLKLSAFEVCRKLRLERLQQRCLSSNVTSDALFGTYDVISDETLLKRVEYIIQDDQHRVLLDAIPKTGQNRVLL